MGKRLRKKQHIESLRDSIEFYSKIMREEDLESLEKLFSKRTINGILGLKNPYEHFSALDFELLDDFEFLEYMYLEEEILEFEGTIFFEEEDNDKEFKDTPDSEHVEEPDTSRDRSAEQAEREFYAILMKLLHWSLKKDRPKFLPDVLRILTTGLMGIGAEYGIWDFELVVKEALGALSNRRRTHVIEKLKDGFRKSGRCLEPIYYMTQFLDSDLNSRQESGRKILFDIVESTILELLGEEISDTLEDYEDMLKLDSIDEIDKIGYFDADAASPLGTFNLIDPVIQMAGFRFLGEFWMMESQDAEDKDRSYDMLMSLYGPEHVSPDDIWARNIRDLIVGALESNIALLQKHPDIGITTAATVRTGTLTDLWVQKIIEWEKRGEYDDTRVTDFYRAMFSQLAAIPMVSKHEDLVGLFTQGVVEHNLDALMNGLVLLETVRVGFLDAGLEKEAKILLQNEKKVLRPHSSLMKERYSAYPAWLSFDQAVLADSMGERMSVEEVREIYRRHRLQESARRGAFLKKLNQTLESIIDDSKEDIRIDEIGQDVKEEILEDIANNMANKLQGVITDLYNEFREFAPNLLGDSKSFWIKEIKEECWENLSDDLRESLESARIIYNRRSQFSIRDAMLLIGAGIEKNIVKILYGFKKWWGEREDYGPAPIIKYEKDPDLVTYEKLVRFLSDDRSKPGFGDISWIIGKLDKPNMTPPKKQNVFSELRRYLEELEIDVFWSVRTIGLMLTAEQEYRDFRVGGEPFFNARNGAAHKSWIKYNQKTWQDLVRFLREFLKHLWVLKYV